MPKNVENKEIKEVKLDNLILDKPVDIKKDGKELKPVLKNNQSKPK